MDGCRNLPPLSWLSLFALFFASAVGPATAPEFADHPDALWRVVNLLCVTDMRLSGFAAPCLAVNLDRGYAIVPDPNRRTQILFVPTQRLTGIESPALLKPHAPNYWRYAWDARGYLNHRVGKDLPRDGIAMAINSVAGRTQDQLHIHIDCVRPGVRAALRSHQSLITGVWSPFPVPLAGHGYRAMRIVGSDLGDQDPFKLLAMRDGATRNHMADQTLAVTGAWFAGRPGFIILAGRNSTPDNPRAAAEDLLDHGCAIGRSR